jgi:hypothetical protein
MARAILETSEVLATKFSIADGKLVLVSNI